MGQEKYRDELRERATRKGVGGAGRHSALARGAASRIAEELGVHPEVLCTWVRDARDRSGDPARHHH